MSYGRRIGARLFVANAVRIERPVASRLRSFLRCDCVWLRPLEGDARVERLPVGAPAEAVDVGANARLRDLDVERHERTRTREARSPHGLRHVGLRAESGRREIDGARVVDDEPERA